ncbi:unnamed protein product [[Candida] boidinii]|nr:unnamed protein product [[Candida] boidinii]
MRQNHLVNQGLPMGGKFQVNNIQASFNQTKPVQESIEDFKSEISNEVDLLRNELKDLRYMVYIQNSTIEELTDEVRNREADLEFCTDKVESLELEVSDLRYALENKNNDTDNKQSSKPSENKTEYSNTIFSHFGDVNNKKSPQSTQETQPPIVAFTGFTSFSDITPATEQFTDTERPNLQDFYFGNSYLKNSGREP